MASLFYVRVNGLVAPQDAHPQRVIVTRDDPVGVVLDGRQRWTGWHTAMLEWNTLTLSGLQWWLQFIPSNSRSGVLTDIVLPCSWSLTAVNGYQNHIQFTEGVIHWPDLTGATEKVNADGVRHLVGMVRLTITHLA